jgi:putative transcriptional regulator
MTTMFEDMMTGLNEVDSFLAGEKAGYKVSVPADVDVKVIRKSLNMTQSRFSDTFGFSLDAVKHWEGGRRTPESSARAFLTVIARNPNAVIAALHPAKVATVGMKRFSSALTSSRKMARRAPTKAKPDRAARGSVEKLKRVPSKVSDAPAEASK